MKSTPSDRLSSKTLLESYQREKEKSFKLTIKSEGTIEPLVLEGYFSLFGNSLYAHCDNPKAIGGSNDSDKDLARIKAIMRMLNAIENKLAGLSPSEMDQLLQGIGREDLRIALKLKTLCNFNPNATSDSSIPVYEEIAEREAGKFRYSRQFKKHVTDFGQVIQEEIKRTDAKVSLNRSFEVSIENPFHYALTPALA